ncbi:MAG: VWA domain-containing protein [Gemmatimonadota bacterium]
MRWILFALLAAGAALYARWVYRRVDLPVPGTRFLWPIRAAALVLVLLLLFDPLVPWGGPGSADRWVLLDASLSMTAGEDGSTPWDQAISRAEALRAEGWRVVTFGGSVERMDSPLEAGADQPVTRLAPALSLAAEGGAREIRVLTDMRLEDEVAVRSALGALSSTVAFEPFGGPVDNAGILGLEVGDRTAAAAEGTAVVEVHGGSEGDTLMVEVYEEGALVAQGSTPAPGAGLRRSVEIPLPAAAASGLLRYEAVLVDPAPDDFTTDDRASSYGRIGVAEEGGVVLVSFSADWEPRYLLPALGRSTGLSTAGYLRVGADRFVPMGRAIDRGAPVDSTAVRLAVDEAALLVLHGVHGGLDAWARSLAARGGRKIVLPSDAAGAALVDLSTSGARSGEWYVTPDLPPSPIAGELAAVTYDGLPPLRRLLVPTSPEGLVRPLLVQMRGGGPLEAPLVLRVGDEGRVAVTLASGFWRWAAREGQRGAYEALWAGVAGWLLRDRPVTGAEVRPGRLVVPRGEDVDWRVPPNRTGYGVRVHSGEQAVLDAVFGAEGVVPTAALAPGTYRYAVFAPEGDSVSGGRFDVAETTADMVPSASDPDRLSTSTPGEGGSVFGGRPLRTLPWPYIMIIGLLCLEWYGRRRSGLR